MRIERAVVLWPGIGSSHGYFPAVASGPTNTNYIKFNLNVTIR